MIIPFGHHSPATFKDAHSIRLVDENTGTTIVQIWGQNEMVQGRRPAAGARAIKSVDVEIDPERLDEQHAVVSGQVKEAKGYLPKPLWHNAQG